VGPGADAGRGAWLAGLLVFLAAAAAYACGGNLGRLTHDDAIYLYGGQELARGTPVYLGVFDHKGPLGQIVCALGVWSADLLGTDTVRATRTLFLAISAGCAAGMFALALALFRNRRQAVLTGLLFVCFFGFGAFAFSGNRPKTLMVLFQVLTFVLCVRGRWLGAGVTGALAALTWQPTGLFLLVVMVLAWCRERGRGLGRVVLGALIPALLVAGMFAAQGALGTLIDASLRFNLEFLESPGSLRGTYRAAMRILLYGGMGLPTLVGLVVFLSFYVWRFRRSRAPEGRGLARDRFAVVLFTFPFPALWSLHDFQQYPDFFVFLPYVSLGLGWVLAAALQGVAERMELRERGRRVLLVAPAVLLLVFAGAGYRFGSRMDLLQQEAEVAAFERAYGDAPLAVVGVPEALVLLERRNVTRYGFVMRGIAAYIEAREPGGFAGWLASIDAAGPEVLIVDEEYPRRLGEHAAAWEAWLAGWEREELTVCGGSVLRRRQG
jgi:hypothetical protein